MGYPLGQKLVDQFTLENRTDESLRSAGVDIPEYRYFCGELLYANPTSIDAFLELRKDLLEIGRAAIAWALIPHENLENMFKKGDWYRYLLSKMRADSLQEIANNRLTIITFNYDRSLEAYLFMALLKMYHDATQATVVEVLSKIPIIHVHGQLDFLGWQTEGKGGRPYDGRFSAEIIRQSAAGIRIVHEATSVEFVEAHKALNEAERIYFVGFGYHPTNMERLRVSWDHKTVVGSSMGLTLAQRNELTARHRRLGLVKGNHDALRFFTNVEPQL